MMAVTVAETIACAPAAVLLAAAGGLSPEGPEGLAAQVDLCVVGSFHLVRDFQKNVDGHPHAQRLCKRDARQSTQKARHSRGADAR